MREVARVEGVRRVRLSSVEVIHVRDSLLTALSGEPKVCPHLHIPMQSGDDDVLRGDGTQLHRRSVPGTRGRGPGGGSRGQHHDRCDRRISHPRPRRRLRGRSRRSTPPASPGSTPSATPRAPEPAPPSWATACRLRRRSAARRCSAAARRSARATTGRPSWDGREPVLIDKVAAVQASGYTADYTRCYLPADAARAAR